MVVALRLPMDSRKRPATRSALNIQAETAQDTEEAFDWINTHDTFLKICISLTEITFKYQVMY